MSHPSPQASSHLSAILVACDPTNPVNLHSGELAVGRQKYKLHALKDGSLQQSFEQPIDLSASKKIQISIAHAKTWFLSRQKTGIAIETADIFGVTRDGYALVEHDQYRISFFFQEQVTKSLHPTTELMLQDCDRFRILVIGRTGVGKSTLIQRAFGIDKASASHLQPGEADIGKELMSPSNPRFVLHDSLGFEPGEKVHYDKVKEFIKGRQEGPLKEQLHAVWFCVKTPCSGERLLEAAMEFFRSKPETLGNIPLVIVFTRTDELGTELLMKGNVAEKDARAKAEAIVLESCVPRISAFMGKPQYAVISTKPNYQDTVGNLVQLTHDLISRNTGHDERDVQVTSLLTSMAQRIVPDLKIQECLHVGEKNYWRAIRKSPDFAGNTIWDFMSVIHIDIVSVWNFNDPRCYLKNDKFMKLVLESVRDVRVRKVPKPGGFLALSGASLVSIISAFVGALASPAAPIVLPIVVGLAGIAWHYGVYQHSKNVEKYFITYIVDLTYVLETLFVLVAGRHERLSRRAIKLALKFYLDSDIRAQVRAEIEDYQKIPGRDNALKLIKQLITNEGDDNSLSAYYSGIREMDLSKLDLDNDSEDW